MEFRKCVECREYKYIEADGKCPTCYDAATTQPTETNTETETETETASDPDTDSNTDTTPRLRFLAATTADTGCCQAVAPRETTPAPTHTAPPRDEETGDDEPQDPIEDPELDPDARTVTLEFGAGHSFETTADQLPHESPVVIVTYGNPCQPAGLVRVSSIVQVSDDYRENLAEASRRASEASFLHAAPAYLAEPHDTTADAPATHPDGGVPDETTAETDRSVRRRGRGRRRRRSRRQRSR